MKKKTKRTALPRLTVLAYSKQELLRFSEAAEKVAGLAHSMVGLFTRLDSQVTRLEKLEASAAARKKVKKGQETQSGGDAQYSSTTPPG